jgi:hypothetical protein
MPGWHAVKGENHEAHSYRRYRTDGSQVVQKLTAAGHEAVPAALPTGVALISGKGLDQALEGASLVQVPGRPGTTLQPPARRLPELRTIPRLRAGTIRKEADEHDEER